MSEEKKILLVDDEPHIILGLSDALQFEGFLVSSAAIGEDAINLCREIRPDAVLLDLMLPDMNGYEVCRRIREFDRVVPVIMLTARSQENDKIRGLDVGADDYVTKPFSVGELIARLRAVMRRSTRQLDSDVIQVGLAEFNLASHTATRVGEEAQALSFYEVELIRLLKEREGQAVSREEILNRVWGVDANPSNRTVDNFIVKLRKKLEPNPALPEYILTVYGYGYKLVQH